VCTSYHGFGALFAAVHESGRCSISGSLLGEAELRLTPYCSDRFRTTALGIEGGYDERSNAPRWLISEAQRIRKGHLKRNRVAIASNGPSGYELDYNNAGMRPTRRNPLPKDYRTYFGHCELSTLGCGKRLLRPARIARVSRVKLRITGSTPAVDKQCAFGTSRGGSALQ